MKPSYEKVVPGPGASFRVAERADRRFGFDWHLHPEYELTLITAGRGTRFVGDDVSDYREGDLVLLGPNLPHTWASRPTPGLKQHRAVFVQFSRTCLGAGFFDLPEARPVARLLEKSGRGLRFAGPTRDRAADQLRALPKLAGIERVAALLRVLGELSRARRAQPIAAAVQAHQPSADAQRRIDRVCRFIYENHAGPLTQAQAAQVAHLSPPAFSRFFKRATGRTFVSYLNELRIAHACRLLAETDRPVTEVALACGYENLSNFNRRFRAIARTTPTAYRQRAAP